MYQEIKKALLHILKLCGAFCISRWLTRNKLRILCYHGFSISDQYRFRPKLFITVETLAARLTYLHNRHFTFLDIAGFDTYINGSSIPSLPLLITIDDGWKSTHELALPVFRQFMAPHIIYLYTDCIEREIVTAFDFLQ